MQISSRLSLLGTGGKYHIKNLTKEADTVSVTATDNDGNVLFFKWEKWQKLLIFGYIFLM